MELGQSADNNPTENLLITVTENERNRWIWGFVEMLFREYKEENIKNGIKGENGFDAVTLDQIYNFARNKYSIGISWTAMKNSLISTNRYVQKKMKKRGARETHQSDLYERSFLTDQNQKPLEFLYHMHHSSLADSELPYYPEWLCVPRKRRELSRNFVGKRCPTCCCFALMMIPLLILSLGLIKLPEGDGLPDIGEYSLIFLILCAIAVVFYSTALIGPDWTNINWCSICVNLFYTVFSFVMFIFFINYFTSPEYYTNLGCFECRECAGANSNLCFDYKKMSFRTRPAASKDISRDMCACSLKEDMWDTVSISVHPTNKRIQNCKDLENDRNKHSKTHVGKYDCFFYEPKYSWLFWNGYYMACVSCLLFLLSAFQLARWFFEFIDWQGVWDCCQLKRRGFDLFKDVKDLERVLTPREREDYLEQSTPPVVQRTDNHRTRMDTFIADRNMRFNNVNQDDCEMVTKARTHRVLSGSTPVPRLLETISSAL